MNILCSEYNRNDMRLLEREAKRLLTSSNLPVPQGEVLTKDTSTDRITVPVVLKSQVPIGGRGKLGGVRVMDKQEEITPAIADLFALDIKGYTPQTVLAEEKLHIKNEHYLSLLIDRQTSSIRLVAHKDGGIEVESNKSEDFLNLPITEEELEECTVQLGDYLGYDHTLLRPFLKNLYAAFIKNDATLLEINPLIYTTDDRLVCGDCKMELDDAATFRHPDWDFEDKPQDTNFVTLDKNGRVATIANGAGLAMATMDAVASAGMKPANFLDIGGGANAESVLKAFRRIMEFPHIDAIVINIFAGITRCDEVAKAIIAAKKQIDALPPLFIRLAGTNFEEAVSLLAEEDIPTLATLDECLQATKEVTRG